MWSLYFSIKLSLECITSKWKIMLYSEMRDKRRYWYSLGRCDAGDEALILMRLGLMKALSCFIMLMKVRVRLLANKLLKYSEWKTTACCDDGFAVIGIIAVAFQDISSLPWRDVDKYRVKFHADFIEMSPLVIIECLYHGDRECFIASSALPWKWARPENNSWRQSLTRHVIGVNVGGNRRWCIAAKYDNRHEVNEKFHLAFMAGNSSRQ